MSLPRHWLRAQPRLTGCGFPRATADFSFEFVSHLFGLVERTRDAADETFNYTLIKLIIALNEQFMVSSVPVQATGQGKLPPPILPEVVGTHKRVRGPNTVLEVLKVKEHESKTFGENVIFILNRAGESRSLCRSRAPLNPKLRTDNTPDSLCVSLLILKILYLLFTTSGTQEYFYTNDLCVLVDVFVRELYNLGEDSEGVGPQRSKDVRNPTDLPCVHHSSNIPTSASCTRYSTILSCGSTRTSAKSSGAASNPSSKGRTIGRWTRRRGDWSSGTCAARGAKACGTARAAPVRRCLPELRRRRLLPPVRSASMRSP